MTSHARQRHGFGVCNSGFWPESADSAPGEDSGFQLFHRKINALERHFQNPEGAFRILRWNLEFRFPINALEQIPESGRSPPKGGRRPPR